MTVHRKREEEGGVGDMQGDGEGDVAWRRRERRREAARLKASSITPSRDGRSALLNNCCNI
jgi:hypothetical protein